MSTIFERIRNRRHADRRAREIAQAIRTAPTASMRRELLEIASRYYS